MAAIFKRFFVTLQTLRTAMLATTFVAGGLLSSQVMAQRTSNPTPVNQNSNQPDLQAFADAYDAAGEPRILVAVGATNTPKALGQLLLGMFAPEDFGHAQALSRSIEEQLLKNNHVELVDPNMIQASVQRERAILAGQNEAQVLKTLNTSLNADLVLMVQLVRDPDILKRGGQFRVMVDSIDVARGRRLTTFTFDWMQGTDAGTIKRYAEQMTRKFVEQYANAMRTGDLSYNLMVMGVADAGDLRKYQQALESNDKVTSVRSRGFSRSTSSSENRGKDTNVGQLRVRYTGNSLDLADLLSSAAESSLKRKATITNAESGIIHVRLGSSSAVAADDGKAWDKEFEKELLAERLIDFMRDDEVSGRVQNTFKEVYRKQGSPKIGVILNRSIDENEASTDDVKKELASPIAEGLAAGTAKGETQSGGQASAGQDGTALNINMGNNQGTSSRTVQLLLQADRDLRTDIRTEKNVVRRDNFTTRLVEDGVSQRLRKLGMTTMDATFVRDRILQKSKNARQFFNEGDLEAILIQQARDAGLDVALVGYSFVNLDARTVRVKNNQVDVNNHHRLGFTMRAVDVASGEILGSVSIAEVKADELQAMVDAMSDHLVGQMAAQLWDTWTGDKVVTVTVSNAKATDQVLALMDAVKKNIKGVQQVDFVRHEPTSQGGVGVFTLQYEGSYSDLLRAVSELGRQGQNAAFQLESRGTSRSELNLKLGDAPKAATTNPEPAAEAQPVKPAATEPVESPAASPDATPEAKPVTDPVTE